MTARAKIKEVFAITQCGGKLSRQLEGPAFDVFSRTLRGLADSKITKPGQFRTEDGSGSAVRCLLKVRQTLLLVLHQMHGNQ